MLARDYLNRQDGRRDSITPNLLRWLLRNNRQRLERADIATLTLLSRQSDPDLRSAAKVSLGTLIDRQPENPGMLAAAIQYHEGFGDKRSAPRYAATARRTEGIRRRLSKTSSCFSARQLS